MPSNQLALAVEHPEAPDMLTAYAKVARVGNMIALQRQHAQQSELSAMRMDEARRSQAEQEALADHYHSNGGDIPAAIKAASADPRIRPGSIAKLQDEFNKQATSAATLESEKFKNLQTKNQILADALAPINELKDDPARQQIAHDTKGAELIKAGVLKPEEFTPWKSPEQVADELTAVRTQKGVYDAADELRKKATADAAAKKATHDQAMAPLQERAEVATADIKGEELVTKRTQSAAELLAGATDQADYADKRGQLPMAMALKFPAVFDKSKVLEVGTTPEQRITNAETAKRNARATAHETEMERQGKQRSDIAQKIFDQTYGPGANEALQGVEPKLRVQATSHAAKAADDYAKGQAAAADMQSLLDLAKAGNKMAYRMIPLEGVLEITTPRGTVRINKNELDAYGGAGSFLDKIQGKLGGALSGASIPSDVLTDIEAMHGKLATGIHDTYNQKLAGINQNYHANFKPVPSRSAEKPAGPADLSGLSTDELFKRLTGGK